MLSLICRVPGFLLVFGEKVLIETCLMVFASRRCSSHGCKVVAPARIVLPAAKLVVVARTFVNPVIAGFGQSCSFMILPQVTSQSGGNARLTAGKRELGSSRRSSYDLLEIHC